jgi:adenylate kinase
MRLILLGPPGSGKGTQAKLLGKAHCLEHIATGDILRDAIARNTPAGAQARPFVESGRLVPDELVNELVRERFARPDRPTRFVMDGYPRTLAQARAFEEILREHGLPLDTVVLIDVPDEAIVQRVSGRWSCPSCKAVYHSQTKPPRVAGVCDEDGTPLVQRADDKPETVRARLKVYHGDTEELVPFYRDRGLLKEVGGTGSIEEVYQKIAGVLPPQAGPSC